MQDEKELPIPALNLERIDRARELLLINLPTETPRLSSYARQEMSQQEAVRFALGEIDLEWDSILREGTNRRVERGRQRRSKRSHKKSD
jgi:hypothetical protein